ncbi:MAG: hypothetical protein AB7D47_13360 [Desulfovibrio sp.]|jgi:hypothetical protein
MRMTSLAVAKGWRDALRGCAALNDYCMERFGRLPRLFLGVDERDLPGAGEAPYVALAPFGVRGGPETGETRITVRLAVGAVLGGTEHLSERETEYPAYARMEEELWPLVLGAIQAADPEAAPATVETEMDALSREFLELRAECVVTLENTIGGY